MDKCIFCGSEVDSDAKFCHMCGEEIIRFMTCCPKCNSFINSKSVYCVNCGSKIGKYRGMNYRYIGSSHSFRYYLGLAFVFAVDIIFLAYLLWGQ